MKRSRSPASNQPRGGLLPKRHGGWLWWFLPALLSGVVAIAIWRSWERATDPAVIHPQHPVAHLLPPVAPSPYLNTRADAQYVGTPRCVECHSDQHASYLHTAHSRSMSLIDPAREPRDGVFDHAASLRRYRSYRRDDQLRHRESLVSTDGGELVLCDQPLKYLIGSGRFSRTYLLEDQGFLVESPLTWYASLNAWAMSPGYDVREHQAFHRTVTFGCLYCHAGSIERVNNNDELIRLGEIAIGCERCHGPGSLHVARHAAGHMQPSPEGDLSIVNPRRLPRERAESICHQCHLSGETQIAVRGRSTADFRPGLRWQDFAIDYGFETAGTEMTVVGHVAQLRQSRCYQGSETLTCITCHAGHEPPAPAERQEHYRAACQRCHAEPSCRIPLAKRTAERGNDCTACHMPQSRTDIPHIAFTHHRIGIHSPEVGTRSVPSARFRPLAPVLDVGHLSEIDRRRGLGLAYLQYRRDHEQSTSADEYFAKARTFLDSTIADGLIDAPVALAQSELAAAANDLIAVERWSQQALAAENLTTKERTAALRMLAGLALQADRLAEAIKFLDELSRTARDPRDWFLLGVCHQRRGNAPAAIAALERVLQIDPGPPETYELLSALYGAQGNESLAKERREQAEMIRKATALKD